MSYSYKDFNTPNYGQDQDRSNNCNTSGDISSSVINRCVDNLGDQNVNFGNAQQQQNLGFTGIPPQSPNLFMNYYKMPPQFTVPPPPIPPPNFQPVTENVSFYSNHPAPNMSFSAQQYSTMPPSNFSSQNIVLPPCPPSRSNILQPQSETIVTSSDNVIQVTGQNHLNKENWITSWLTSVGKLKTTNPPKGGVTNSSGVKIYEFRDKIIKISTLFNKLENLTKSLSVTYKSLNEFEWSLRCHEIEDLKKQLSGLLLPLRNDEKLLLDMKWRVGKRKKKRERQKRKKEEYKTMKVDSSIKRQQLHHSIDQWLEDMRENVERARRDEELKREADTVLADVTRKKTDAKRQIALLSALLQLRQARVTAQTAIGRNISQAQTEAFNNVIERLKTLWTNQLNEYLLEEQGLKVMLNEAAAEEKNSEALKKKEALLEWEKALFGGAKKPSEYRPHNINELIAVRKQWDQFVVPEGTIMSSSIPLGWLVPVKASDSEWEKYNVPHFE